MESRDRCELVWQILSDNLKPERCPCVSRKERRSQLRPYPKLLEGDDTVSYLSRSAKLPMHAFFLRGLKVPEDDLRCR